ncbi:MAG: Flp pilus assembly protein CpaB [Chloroflexota bacterium]|jgi:pilus assembly protein CpaB
MNRKRIGAILVVLGVVLALAVGAVVYLRAEEAAEIARRIPTVEVVVALTDLPERVAIQPSSVALTKVPVDIVPPEKAVDLNSVVGRYPLVKIFKGEILIQPKLADGSTQTTPSFLLDEGMVALTYSGNDLLTPTGAIRPGDRVDILLTLPLTRPPAQGSTDPPPSIPQVTQTLVQNVEVLRVGGFPVGNQPEGAAAGKGITFQVSHQDALVLKWAKDSGGTIDLVLRHPSDNEPVSTEAITANYIIDQYNFLLAEPLQQQ